MSKKSLFKKIIDLFNVKQHGHFGRNISVGEAIDIQDAYVSASYNDDKLPDSPYAEIAKQLSSPKQEVFEAALYYLHRIAVNEKKNRLRIAGLLESICNESKINNANKELIMRTVEKIKGKAQ